MIAKKALTKKAAHLFSDQRTAMALASALNAEEHKALYVTPQPPNWEENPCDIKGTILTNRSGLNEPAIFLPLYAEPSLKRSFMRAATLLEKNGRYYLTGDALNDFKKSKRKLLDLKIIAEGAHVKPIINKSRTGPNNTFKFVAHLGIEAHRIDLSRLLALRDHFTTGYKIIDLIDHVYKLNNSSVEIIPPSLKRNRASILYSDINPDELTAILKPGKFAAWLDESLEAHVEINTDIQRGLPRVFAPFVIDGDVTEEQASLAFDAENPDLYRKLLEISVLKDFILLSDINHEAAAKLIRKLSVILNGENPPAVTPMIDTTPAALLLP